MTESKKLIKQLKDEKKSGDKKKARRILENYLSGSEPDVKCIPAQLVEELQKGLEKRDFDVRVFDKVTETGAKELNSIAKKALFSGIPDNSDPIWKQVTCTEKGFNELLKALEAASDAIGVHLLMFLTEIQTLYTGITIGHSAIKRRLKKKQQFGTTPSPSPSPLVRPVSPPPTLSRTVSSFSGLSIVPPPPHGGASTCETPRFPESLVLSRTISSKARCGTLLRTGRAGLLSIPTSPSCSSFSTGQQTPLNPIRLGGSPSSSPSTSPTSDAADEIAAIAAGGKSINVVGESMEKVTDSQSRPILQSVRRSSMSLTAVDCREGRRLDTSFRLPGAILCITPVNHEIWIATGGTGGCISIFDLKSFAKLSELPVDSTPISMSYIKGKVWTTSGDNFVRVYDPKERKLLLKLDGHTLGPVFGLTAIDDKQVWSIGSDQAIAVWDLVTMKRIKVINTGNYVQSILYYQGHVWVGTATGILIYNAKTYKQEKRAKANNKTMLVNKMLVVGNTIWAANQNNQLISIWDTKTHSQIGTITNAHHIVDMLLVGPLVWTCAKDRTIRLYDVQTKIMVKELQGTHDDGVTAISMAGGSDSWLKVWTGSVDHTICVWNTDQHAHVFAPASANKDIPCIYCGFSVQSTPAAACRGCEAVACHCQCLDYLPPLACSQDKHADHQSPFTWSPQ